MTADDKRRAKYRKYAASPKGKARRDRYTASAKGKAARVRKDAKCNARRIWIGQRCVGYARVGLDVAAIRRHIKDRLHAFKQGLKSRAAVEAVSAVGISSEAGY